MEFRVVAYCLASVALLGAAGCASTPEESQAISIPYDPYDFHPDDLLAEANSYCEAYGLRAFYVDETIDPHSVRWRYRHYDCV
ncbi:MAG: hypothetical protein AAGC77_12770 [Pseudomonadota bacterium]